jgi:hypothetical protein
MPSFPTYTFDKSLVRARFLEPNGSSSINTRHYGLPRGVYLGYTPEVTAGSLILKLKPDPRLGFSTLKVGAQSTRAQLDVIAAGDVELDFTGHTVYPVYVLARADYKAGTPSQGRILTRTTGPSGPQEIVLCRISKPAADLVADVTVPTNRHPPLAFSGQGVGYMYGGATDDLVFAQTATAEVIKARDNLETPPPPPSATLSQRLGLDLTGQFIADQLALKSATIVGNARLILAGATSMNVSDSFSELSREFQPLLTLEPNANETTEGIVTAPGDTDRNVAYLIDETSGLRLETATGGPVYGRVAYTTAPLTGTLTFSLSLDTVNGVGTLFLTELQIGDLISAPDGKFYAVEAVANNTNLTISLAYQATTFSGFVSTRRRFTMSFLSRTTGAEVAYALAQNTILRPFFSGWFKLNRSIFDASTFMKKNGEMPNVPAASDAVRGLVKLATNGGLAGAIYQITNAQSAVGANNFHTLNFTGVNASIIDAGGGVANLSIPGNPGPPGPGSAVGPTGSPGLPGPGASAFNSWEGSGLFGVGGAHTFNVTFASATPPFAGNLDHVVGGMSLYATFSSPFGWNGFRITGISKSGNIGTINLDLTTVFGNSETTGKVFLGGCT